MLQYMVDKPLLVGNNKSPTRDWVFWPNRWLTSNFFGWIRPVMGQRPGDLRYPQIAGYWMVILPNMVIS